MTGILPIKKYGTHSVLNMFDELSMTAPGDLAPFFGFTSQETSALCSVWNMDFAEVERWYDGYRLGGLHMYSPRSVVLALTRGRCSDYWTSTESYEALQTYIETACARPWWRCSPASHNPSTRRRSPTT